LNFKAGQQQQILLSVLDGKSRYENPGNSHYEQGSGKTLICLRTKFSTSP
jgi:hypothetical protein